MSYWGLRSETARCCSRGNGQTAYTIWSKVGELLSSLTAEFQTASASNISTWTVHWELHEKGLRGRVAACKSLITMLNAKCQLEWCKACWPGVCSSGNMFFWVCWTNLGLANAKRMLPTKMHSAYCKVWWRMVDWGLSFRVWAMALSSRKSLYGYKDILDNEALPALRQWYRYGHLLFQHDWTKTCAHESSIKTSLVWSHSIGLHTLQNFV